VGITTIVYPEYRRRGTARQLLKNMISEYGNRNIYVTVEHDNIASMNLHTTAGFIDIGQAIRPGNYRILLRK